MPLKVVTNLVLSQIDVFIFNIWMSFSEMFIDTGKFSTRTVSAINNLEGAEMRHKKESDYQWRKEMEEWVDSTVLFILN